MKLSRTQIVLGVLIVFAACYITGWMIHKAPSQLRQPLPDSGGDVTYVDVIPEHEALFNVSRYGSYLLPVLGVFVLIIGTVQAVKSEARTRRLAAAGIIAGLLIAALAFIITTWGYPTTFHMVMPEGSDTAVTIFGNPGRTLVGVQLISGAMFLLGLVVLGVGITQLVKSRKLTNS